MIIDAPVSPTAGTAPVEPVFAALPRQAMLTRCVDVFGAVLLIVVLLPVFIIIALVCGMTSEGSPIFSHQRVGQGGIRFGCLKFRTMYAGSEQKLTVLLQQQPALRAEWEAGFKLRHDPRVTPFGRILRVTSLDELPQLFNVLRGDMSLVGPRPIVTAELARYGRYAESYLVMKPGLTGLWQVTGRSGSNYRHRIAADHLYALKKNALFDLRIILATVPAVLIGKGAC